MMKTAAPSIYLEHYEEQFGKGRPMDDIMKEIAQIKNRKQPGASY